MDGGNAVPRMDGFGVVLEGIPEAIPHGSFAFGGVHLVYLFEGCVCEFQNVDDADDSILRINYREIKIVSIYKKDRLILSEKLGGVPCIFRSAAWMLRSSFAVSGWGVMTLTTDVLLGS